MACVSPVYLKLFMGLSPSALLSNASREKCIAKIYQLPAVNIRGGRTKHFATVLVPICVDNGEVCLLYTLRSSNLFGYSCQVAFPGGKIYRNESVYESVLRETEDNIGVPPKDVDIWTKMGQVQSRKINFPITPVVGEIKNFDINKLIPNEEEVDDIFTIPMRVFCDTDNHGNCRYNGVMTPVFSGGKHRVWGITAMITHRFLYAFIPSEIYAAGFYKRKFKLHELLPPDE